MSKDEPTAEEIIARTSDTEKTHPLADLLPEWQQELPSTVGMAALMGSPEARQLVGLFENYWNKAYAAGKRDALKEKE